MEKEEEKGENGEQVLPALTIGELLKLRDIEPIEVLGKQTQPPPRFNEASLIKTLEEYGIGRPSTYAPTISTIQDRMYVEKEERKFVPTELGISVNDFLIKYFADILDYQFTATLENDLDRIASGEITWVPTIRNFYEPFALKLDKVKETAERVVIKTEQTDEICPQCQAPLVVRIGRFGKFLACSKFPECKFTKQYKEKIGIKCPKCGGDIILRQTKKRRKFYGCSNYPKCDFASWRKPKSEEAENQPEEKAEKDNQG